MPIQNEKKTFLISKAFSISEKNIILGYYITKEREQTLNDVSKGGHTFSRVN